MCWVMIWTTDKNNYEPAYRQAGLSAPSADRQALADELITKYVCPVCHRQAHERLTSSNLRFLAPVCNRQAGDQREQLYPSDSLLIVSYV